MKRAVKILVLQLVMIIPLTTVAQPNPPDIADFKIMVEWTDKGIRMQGLEGSAWLDLTFGIDRNSDPQAIDEFGMTNLLKTASRKDPNLADFLFTVEVKDGQVLLKGLEGMAWTELGFTLPRGDKQLIDQFGMTGE